MGVNTIPVNPPQQPAPSPTLTPEQMRMRNPQNYSVELSNDLLITLKNHNTFISKKSVCIFVVQPRGIRSDSEGKLGDSV